MSKSSENISSVVLTAPLMNEEIEFREARLLEYPIGEYVVKVLLSPENEFLGIIEIGVDKDFRTHQQRMANVVFHDVDKYYEDNEP